MLSAHFWMSTGATLGMAAVMGLGLGSYVTSPQAPSRAAEALIDTPIDGEEASETALAVQTGPGIIDCKGCGPTLADRRWQADMAASHAGVNVDVGVGQDASPDDPHDVQLTDGPTEPPSPVQPLQPQVARLISSETPPPDMVKRGGMDDTPPPVVVAAAAEPERP